jgi:hypothetical protein
VLAFTSSGTSAREIWLRRGNRGGVQLARLSGGKSVDLNCLGRGLSATFCFHHRLTSLQLLYYCCGITLQSRGKWCFFVSTFSILTIAPGNNLSVLSAELPCFPIRHIPLSSTVYSKSLAPHGTDLPLANHSVNQSSLLSHYYSFAHVAREDSYCTCRQNSRVAC